MVIICIDVVLLKLCMYFINLCNKHDTTYIITNKVRRRSVLACIMCSSYKFMIKLGETCFLFANEMSRHHENEDKYEVVLKMLKSCLKLAQLSSSTSSYTNICGIGESLLHISCNWIWGWLSNVTTIRPRVVEKMINEPWLKNMGNKMWIFEARTKCIDECGAKTFNDHLIVVNLGK